MRQVKKSHLNQKLEQYEQDIEDNLDKIKPLSSKDKTRELNKLQSAAKEYVKKRNKEKRISIRVFASDLERIKEIAEEEGLPYQTLVTSILHKFSTGRLVPKEQKKIT
ncbi:MAG TPA: antitoxin [Verrucomicrobiae bacterium]|nr:antitoxin [Verrucomicrobiae bacterium]